MPLIYAPRKERELHQCDDALKIPTTGGVGRISGRRRDRGSHRTTTP